MGRSDGGGCWLLENRPRILKRETAQQLDMSWKGWRNTNTALPGVVLPSSRRVRSTATVPSIGINIWVTIPPHENIVVSHQPSDDRGHVHVEVAIKDAFAAARRQIETLAQRASGKVKLHFRKPQNG